MPRMHVETILAADSVPSTLHEAVRRTGASASFRPLDEALRSGVSAVADAIVIVGPNDMRSLERQFRVLFDRIADHPRAVLLLKAGGGRVPRLVHPESVPVIFGCGLGAEELSSRLATMLEMRPSLDSLHRGLLANRRQEESATQLYKSQLRLASQLQREFIPETLPELGQVSFSALFRPADYVSGDIYDVHRLDEEHVAIALADATGHGIPAALLTVFIKRALRGKEVHNGSYRILSPDEVLIRLNDELLEANLSECRFVATTYAVLNTRTLKLSLARGGAPYPILRRNNGNLTLLKPSGGVVGVLPDIQFAVETIQLEPGDALIICSDGVESVVCPQLSAHALAETFTRAAEALAECHTKPARDSAVPQPVYAHATDGHFTPDHLSSASTATMTTLAVAEIPPRGNGTGQETRSNTHVRKNRLHWIDSALKRRGFSPEQALLASAWGTTLRENGPQAALEQLSIRHDSLRRMGLPLDDLTVLALQVRA